MSVVLINFRICYWIVINASPLSVRHQLYWCALQFLVIVPTTNNNRLKIKISQNFYFVCCRFLNAPNNFAAAKTHDAMQTAQQSTHSKLARNNSCFYTESVYSLFLFFPHNSTAHRRVTGTTHCCYNILVIAFIAYLHHSSIIINHRNYPLKDERSIAQGIEDLPRLWNEQ